MRYNYFNDLFALYCFFEFCLIQYTVSREGAPDIYFGDDDTIRQFWHDDSIGHSGAMHLFYRPVNDMRVLLPLVVCIIVAWIRSFFFLMGTYSSPIHVLLKHYALTRSITSSFRSCVVLYCL